MLHLDKILKTWKDAAAFGDRINRYGFWNEMAFLTKSGDLGMVLRVRGVDDEGLDYGEQEYAVKRLEAALKNFGSGFDVYRYLFKTNNPEIPFADEDNPLVQTGQDRRRKHFRERADRLFEIEIYHRILLEGARSKTGVGAAVQRPFQDPAGGLNELKAQFSNRGMKILLRTQIERDLAQLEQGVQAFMHQLSDFVRIETLDDKGQFRFVRRLVNYDDWCIAGEPKHSQLLGDQRRAEAAGETPPARNRSGDVRKAGKVDRHLPMRARVHPSRRSGAVPRTLAT
jgi:type IV secretion system protein TrbE